MEKWLNFNAGVILTYEEVRPLTEAGCEIYPMQWVESGQKRTSAEGYDHVSVPAKHKSRLW